jgi:hypothetical protein
VKELVQWSARRLGSGETFNGIAAPRNPLAPSTSSHTLLSPELLASGMRMPELLDRWRAFVRETDVLCSWGHYAASLFAKAGGYLPGVRLDLRQLARVVAKGRVGTLEGFAQKVDAVVLEAGVPGRAGPRLGHVSSIATHFIGLAKAEREAAESRGSMPTLNRGSSSDAPP